MARNVVVTTARATTKVARATVTGATRTTAAMAMVMTAATTATAATAATMAPNGDKHNNQILSQHQRRGTWW